MKDKLVTNSRSEMTWQELLQEWLNDDCDWLAEDIGPLAAFKRAVPVAVVAEHKHRYEGEDMGAYRTLSRAIDALLAPEPAVSIVMRLEDSRDALKRRMLREGYSFDSASGAVYPPSDLAAADLDRARTVQRAYDMARAVEDGGDPGLETVAAVFNEAFGGNTAFNPETFDKPGTITVTTKCNAGLHVLMDDDNLDLVTIPLAEDEVPRNTVQAATRRRWLPLCRGRVAGGHRNESADVGEVTDLASLYAHISREDHEQIQRFLGMPPRRGGRSRRGL